MVRLERESLNIFDELIDVFEDWDSQLRAANVEQFADLGDENQHSDETTCCAMQHDFEPGGLS